jgi:hypothetical protein
MAKKNRCIAESWTYVLLSDRTLPPDQQTRFTLRPMTAPERDQVRDNLSWTQLHIDGAHTRVNRTRQSARAIALNHIAGIDNFPVGAPQSWPKDRDAQARYLDMLEDGDVLEIGNEVFDRSTLGPDEGDIKNSSTPERTSASGASSQGDISTTAPSAPSSPP